MKQSIYLLLFAICISACGGNEKAPATTTDTQAVSLLDLKNDFRFQNLSEFEVDTFSWETRPGEYKKLDSITFNIVWQDTTRYFTGDWYDKDYLFSWQDRDSNFIELSILTQNESDWCNNIIYCIYDRKGKMIDKFIAASSCGDGGWTFSSSGEFINRNTYDKHSVEIELYQVDDNDKEQYTGDSVLTRYEIGRDGKVTEQQVYKRHFNGEW